MLRDIGADDYEEAAAEVDKYELIDQTIIGIVDVYLTLLPELRTPELRYWLSHRYP